MSFSDIVTIDDSSTRQLVDGKLVFGSCSNRVAIGNTPAGTHFASGSWDLFGDGLLSLIPESAQVSVSLKVTL
jgi:hypothetical protein